MRLLHPFGIDEDSLHHLLQRRAKAYQRDLTASRRLLGRVRTRTEHLRAYLSLLREETTALTREEQRILRLSEGDGETWLQAMDEEQQQELSREQQRLEDLQRELSTVRQQVHQLGKSVLTLIQPYLDRGPDH